MKLQRLTILVIMGMLMVLVMTVVRPPTVSASYILLSDNAYRGYGSPDGRTILFYGRLENGNIDLYTTPVTGTDATLLGENVVSHRVTDDSQSVLLWEVAPARGGAMQLVRVPIHGGNREILAEGEGVVNNGIYITPDGSRTLYKAYAEEPTPFHYGLFRLELEGGTPVRLDTPDEVGAVEQVVVSPDGQWVAFSIRETYENGEPVRLYFTSMNGGIPVQLNTVGSSLGNLQFTADNRHLIFTTYLTTAPYPAEDMYRLYSMDVETQNLITLTADSPQFGIKRLSQGNGLIVQRAIGYYFYTERNEILYLTADGLSTIQLYEDKPTTVTELLTISDDTAVLAQTDYTIPDEDITTLQSVALDGNSSPIPLTGDIEYSSDSNPAIQVRFIANATEILYSPARLGTEWGYLYRVPLDGSVAPVPVVEGQIVGKWEVTPDEQTIFATVLYYNSESMATIPTIGGDPTILFMARDPSSHDLDFYPRPLINNHLLFYDRYTGYVYLADGPLPRVWLPLVNQQHIN